MDRAIIVLIPPLGKVTVNPHKRVLRFVTCFWLQWAQIPVRVFQKNKQTNKSNALSFSPMVDQDIQLTPLLVYVLYLKLLGEKIIKDHKKKGRNPDE